MINERRPVNNPIREKSYVLAVRVVKLCSGPLGRRIAPIRKQLLRSGTSVGANIEESQSAESRYDFAHKIALALKEARETHYWLRLSRDAGLLPAEVVRECLGLADEITRMGSRIIKSTNTPPAA